MTKNQLANELRSAQRWLGTLPKTLIEAIPDDDLIASYVTCSCCDEPKVADPADLDRLIGEATDAHDFIRRVNEHAELEARKLNAKRVAEVGRALLEGRNGKRD